MAVGFFDFIEITDCRASVYNRKSGFKKGASKQ
jgi:hypothetical protein